MMKTKQAPPAQRTAFDEDVEQACALTKTIRVDPFKLEEVERAVATVAANIQRAFDARFMPTIHKMTWRDRLWFSAELLAPFPWLFCRWKVVGGCHLLHGFVFHYRAVKWCREVTGVASH